MVPFAQPRPNRRLESWKEIAAYLKRDVRTVQRWEKREGLPVHRHMHSERGTVYALTFDLDAWWDARGKALPGSEADEPRTPGTAARLVMGVRLAVGIALLLLVAAGGTWLFVSRGRLPAHAPASQRHAAGARRLFAAATREGGQPKSVFFPDGLSLLAINPVSGELYASGPEPALVSFVDPRRLAVTRTVRVSSAPSGLAVSSDGARLYVALSAGDVAVIDLRSGEATRIPLGGVVLGTIVLGPDGNRLYAAMPYAGLRMLTLSDGRVENIRTTGCPIQLALNASGERLYVSYQCGGPGGRGGHDALDVIDTRTNTVIRTAVGPPNVGGVVSITPDNRQLWVSGTDACINPAYDHTGCPVVPAAIVNVWRLDDMFLLRTVAMQLVAGSIEDQVGGIAGSFQHPARTRAGQERLDAQ